MARATWAGGGARRPTSASFCEHARVTSVTIVTLNLCVAQKRIGPHGQLVPLIDSSVRVGLRIRRMR